MFKKGDKVVRITGCYGGMRAGDKDVVIECNDRGMLLQKHGYVHDILTFKLASEEKVMTSSELYLATAKACSIKKGDTVKLLRPFIDYEMGIYLPVGDSCKPEWIGTTGVVERMDLRGAFVVRFGNAACHHYYPWFVLELVNSPQMVVLNSAYTAVVDRTGVAVGCQKFPHEKVDELYAASVKARRHDGY